MKTKRIMMMMVVAVAAVTLAAPLGAQEPDPFGDPAPRKDLPERPKQGRDPLRGAPGGGGLKSAPMAGDMAKLRKEMADLEAATTARRKELMKRMGELQAREEQKRRQAEMEKKGMRDLAPWFEAGQQEPEWVIGIMIEEHGDKEHPGVKVQRVPEGTPAAKAGLKPGDLIVACNRIHLRDREALVHIIQGARDQPLKLTVKRDADGDGGPDEVELTVRAEKREVPKRGTGMTQSAYRDFVDRQLTNQFGGGQPWIYPMPSPAPQNKKEMEELKKQMGELKKMLEKLSREVGRLKAG